jgi:hemoglobin
MESNTRTIYEKLGDDRLMELVTTFYDLVQLSPILAPLFKGDFTSIRDKQFCFLSQFLGGPLRYNEKYGHPKMRLRHLPHPIDEIAKDEWLVCMKKAINSLNLEPNLAEALYQCFPPVAAHMVNR